MSGPHKTYVSGTDMLRQSYVLPKCDRSFWLKSRDSQGFMLAASAKLLTFFWGKHLIKSVFSEVFLWVCSYTCSKTVGDYVNVIVVHYA